MAESPQESCPRPYRLGRRLESANQNRQRVLDAARDLLVSEGVTEFSFEAIARRAAVTRQTIHNQFGTKSGLLEALCDELARKGGMEGIAVAFQQREPLESLREIIAVFCRFWSSDPMMTRRIHGLGNVDPEFRGVLDARDQRRRTIAKAIMSRLAARYGKPASSEMTAAIDVFCALTSFEYYDLLAHGHRKQSETAIIIARLIQGFIDIA